MRYIQNAPVLFMFSDIMSIKIQNFSPLNFSCIYVVYAANNLHIIPVVLACLWKNAMKRKLERKNLQLSKIRKTVKIYHLL